MLQERSRGLTPCLVPLRIGTLHQLLQASIPRSDDHLFGDIAEHLLLLVTYY